MDHQLRRADTAKINKPGTEALQACLFFFMLKRILQTIHSIAIQKYAFLRGRYSLFYLTLSCISFSFTNFSSTLKSSVTFLNGKDSNALSR